ncbi:hypothetical protein [Pseudonocardia pini]|nr:hypothetical protein [Pseudonocardia pini]
MAVVPRAVGTPMLRAIMEAGDDPLAAHFRSLSRAGELASAE